MACCTRLRLKMRGMLERGSHGLLHAATPEDARHAWGMACCTRLRLKQGLLRGTALLGERCGAAAKRLRQLRARHAPLWVLCTGGNVFAEKTL